ncbi:glycosyltransferase [Granulicella sp. dw_53]|uniref:glycosyltransferase n=1 Tax=Granulicella sp. dw_53 TaxID=2719792 RepID=UPI001BD36ED0|nr:glycosyltransferase [Granulicella sp. dw_53]
MHWNVGIGWGLLALGGFGLLSSTVFLGMVLVGAARFRREAEAQEVELRKSPAFLPAVSLLKPLHGAEVGLEGNLRGFYEQDYLRHAVANGDSAVVNGVSRVEVLFCARNEDDAGLAIARRVAAEYPEVTTRFCTSGEPWAANAKVCSLVTIAKVATHDLWVISDSDVQVGPEYLRHVVLPFADAQVGCATCLYRGVAVEHGLWSQLEAVGMSIEMSSGVCVANLLEPMEFALGPTMVARRESVAAIGGFEATAEYCADDFVLGNWIAKKGYKVTMIGHAIDHMVLHAGFVDSIKHQVRWMKSTRFSRPKGHFGTSLTFGVPFGLLAWVGALLLGMPGLGWSLLVASVLGRSLQAWVVGKFVVRKRRNLSTMILFPLRDLMGMLFWALSYTSNRILWRGEVYELVEDGRMVKARVRG